MKIKTDVLAALDGCALDGNKLVLAGQLDRRLYQEVARVIEAAGGKWNRSARAHLFEGSAADAIEPVLLTGEVTNRKQEFGQFYTPADIAQLVIMAARIKPGDEVLEPSAGRGDIAAAAVVAGATVDCVEIDDKNAAFLADDRRYRMVMRRDFLGMAPLPVYDAVIGNPPFAKQADIHHVRFAARHLKEGGRLAFVMSAGVAFRQNSLTAAFRHFILNEKGGSIDALPDNAFKESGTSVNTVLVSF